MPALNFRPYFLLVAFLATASAFSQAPAQTLVSETFRLTGPCCTCEQTRIDSLLRIFPGYQSCVYNPLQQSLTVTFDKEKASLITLKLELSVKGYDAGEFAHTPAMGMSSCCGGKRLDVKGPGNPPDSLQGEDDLDGLDMIEEEDSLPEDELDEDILLEDEPEDDVILEEEFPEDWPMDEPDPEENEPKPEQKPKLPPK